MKILILGFTKIKYLPYLRLHLENIDLEKNDVHVVLWDRDGEEDEKLNAPVTWHTYRFFLKPGIPKRKKLGGFLGYRKFVKKLMKEIKFDFVIPMHTFPGFLLSDVLARKFKGRYIYDYRDKTFEHIGFFKRIIHKVVRNSRATFVSSNGFRQYLPEKNEIYTVHNYLKDSLSHRPEAPKAKSDKISLAFWGMIRPLSVNLTMIEKLANDPRFELHYYGTISPLVKSLQKKTEELNANNVFFHGTYVSTDRYEFAARTDIIHNLFANDNMQFAMANKFYDGMIFYIPQICMKGSFMGSWAEEAGIGKMLDPAEEDFADQLWQYYSALDLTAFKENCDRVLSDVIAEQDKACALLKSL